MNVRAILLVSALAGVACGNAPEVGSTSQGLDAQGGHGAAEPPMLGIHWARGAKPGGGGGSPDLLWHGGAIMTSTAATAIFWGVSWGSASFVGDKVSGLGTFYQGIGGSPYMGTNTEYTGTNGQVGPGVSYGGYVIDLSAAPSRAPKTSTIAAEVCRAIANPVSNGYYPVYIDQPRGHAGYCAWHSYATCSGVPIQFAFFFNLDGDAGCDPADSSGLHSQGLAALANVSGHELSEAVTDPRSGGWWDSSGAENADKCAWTFHAPVSFGGTSWKIQGNWSNAAYDNGQTGYALGGCVDGN